MRLSLHGVSTTKLYMSTFDVQSCKFVLLEFLNVMSIRPSSILSAFSSHHWDFSSLVLTSSFHKLGSVCSCISRCYLLTVTRFLSSSSLFSLLSSSLNQSRCFLCGLPSTSSAVSYATFFRVSHCSGIPLCHFSSLMLSFIFGSSSSCIVMRRLCSQQKANKFNFRVTFTEPMIANHSRPTDLDAIHEIKQKLR